MLNFGASKPRVRGGPGPPGPPPGSAPASLLLISVTIPIAGMIWMISLLSSIGIKLRSFVLDTFFYICGEIICTFCTMFIVVICGAAHFSGH